MNGEYIVSGIIAVLLLGYLAYALLRPAVERVGRVLFSVRDTGEGIAPDALPGLFSRFVQVNGNVGGTGLGLALVKRLVEAQGGQVSVESREGEGTTFTFSLPAGGPASVIRG